MVGYIYIYQYISYICKCGLLTQEFCFTLHRSYINASPSVPRHRWNEAAWDWCHLLPAPRYTMGIWLEVEHRQACQGKKAKEHEVSWSLFVENHFVVSILEVRSTSVSKVDRQAFRLFHGCPWSLRTFGPFGNAPAGKWRHPQTSNWAEGWFTTKNHLIPAGFPPLAMAVSAMELDHAQYPGKWGEILCLAFKCGNKLKIDEVSPRRFPARLRSLTA